MAIFFLGSLASSLAQSVVQLIIFRAITGIGGGGLILLGQLIVGDVVTVRERGKYQGILVSNLRALNAIEETVADAKICKGGLCGLVKRNRTSHWCCVLAKSILVRLNILSNAHICLIVPTQALDISDEYAARSICLGLRVLFHAVEKGAWHCVGVSFVFRLWWNRVLIG